MKIRIRGQSLRLRLGQSEVRRLADGATVEESIEYAVGVQQTFAIAPGGDAIGLHSDLRTVTVQVPRGVLADWAASETVGLDADLPAGPATTLRVLIEKDFACIENENGEPQDDAFPNPSATC